MPQGSYNVSRLLQELGLKNVVEMPIADNIQTVLPLPTMAGHVPQHNGRVALFGGVQGGVVGEFSLFDIHCLDPGGGIVLGAASDLAPKDVILRPTPPTWGGVGPVAVPASDYTNDPTVSVCTKGSQVAAVGFTAPRMYQSIQPSPLAQLYVPRGQHFRILSTTVNAQVSLHIQWIGIGATESEES
jgi:hypothetical protein